MGFPEMLAQARKARGLSQEDLAAKVGVSRQAVSKWETGDASPDLARLLALADALDLGLDELCGREKAPPAEETAEPPAQCKRASWLLPALCGFLAAGLLAGGLWGWYRHRLGISPAEEATAYTTLPEEFTVSGAAFSPAGTENRRTLGYSFTPSVSGGEWSYQITFTTSSGISKTFDTDCKGGVCAGEVFLAQYENYTVTASIADGMGNSRNAVLATALSFSDTSARWTPVEG